MKGTVHNRIQKYACVTPDQMIQDIKFSPNGLLQEQVNEYRQKYGSNAQSATNQNSLFHCVRRAFINPFSIVLFVLAAISFITDILRPDGYGQGISSVAIIGVMLVISGIVRLVQEIRSKRITDRLAGIVNTTVSVCRDGAWMEVSSDTLVVGDLVRLVAGDRVPADIRLLTAQDLFVSQSVITGESGILEKTPAALVESPKKISDYENTLFLGSTITGGSGTGIVLAVGTDTVYGAFSTSGINRKQAFDRDANSIAWVLIRFMAVLVPVVFVACGLTKGNWIEAFLFGLSIAVGLTPELLPMVVNACLAKGCYQMGQKQTIVKNINAMQGFGSMDVLCVDKTGTLTSDEILLEYYLDILGNESSQVLDYAFLNSHYHTGVKNYLDTAILQCRIMPGKEEHFENLIASFPKLDEQPFDYNRKYAGVLLGGDTGNLIIIKGSVEEVLGCCRYAEYHGQVTEIGNDALQNVHTIVDEMTEDGTKVLAVAYKKTDSCILPCTEQDFILIGYLAFFDAPKQSAVSAIEKLKALRVDIRVLTGDGYKTTLSVCRRLNIDTDSVLTGSQLDQLSDDELPLCIEKTTVFTELSPKQKAKIVETLQFNGHTVGFLGDGMNDLPAELQADVGISVDTAAEAIKESADVILLKKDLNVLEQGILEGRKAFINMKKYIKITASSNLGNILAVLIAAVLLPFFPMTSVQLLLLNLLYDILCLILPWDTVDDELLTVPLQRTGKTLGRFMTRFGPISSVFDGMTFAFLYFILCPAVCGGPFGALDMARQAQFITIFQTGWFLESMWSQVLILHLLRTPTTPFVQSRPSRPVIWTTVLGIVLFTLLTITPLGKLIGLTALPVGYYGFLVVNVVLYLLAGTVAKRFYLKKYYELL